MEDNFKELRNFICATDEEKKRFRQLVVNGKIQIPCFLSPLLKTLLRTVPHLFRFSSSLVVLATDICDAELKKLRNGRWAKAFSGEVATTPEEVTAAVNRKATIILEHLIQASDVGK